MNMSARIDGLPTSEARLPVVAHHAVHLNDDTHSQISALAQKITVEEPRLCRAPQLADNLRSGMLDAPALVLEDHSGIQLAHERGADSNLSYRALLLAGEGDLLAVYGERYPAFEAYCRDQLGLGHVEVLAPELANPEQSLASACLTDVRVIEGALARAQDAGGLNIIPYMVTGTIWHLANEIARRASVPVRLVGPSPALMSAANDKLWFARRAVQLLGQDAIPHSRAVYGMAALTGHLRRFMQQHGRVAIKMSHSAASLGNLVFDSADLANLSVPQLTDRLHALIAESGWENPFPMQVTAWEGPLLSTPSAQLWIPHAEDGPPALEGLFDQIVTHTNARFAGAVPCDLPEPMQARIAHDACKLGLLFQALGYFGRCSFDAVVVDKRDEPPQLHWVECNGRWGGVSIPMTLANRLLGDWAQREVLILESASQSGTPLDFDTFMDRCGPRMLSAGGDGLGAVLLTPGRLSRGAYDLLILGNSQRDVAAREQDIRSILAG